MENNDSYLAMAKDLFENIVSDKKGWYQHFIPIVLNDYNINWNEDQKILKVLGIISKTVCTPYLWFWETNEEPFFGFAFKDKENFIEDTSSNPGLNRYRINLNSELEKVLDKDLDLDKDNIVKQLCAILSAQIISDNINKITITQNDSIEELKKKLTSSQSFGLFCVKYVYTYHIIEFQKYSAAYTLLFFSYLWKSVAVGEFYFLPGYVKLIQPSSVSPSNELFKDVIYQDVYPDFIYCFSDVLYALETFLKRITKDVGSYELYYELNFDLNVETALEKYKNKESDLIKLLMNLTQKLFDVTVIDIRYFTSDANLSTLANFVYGINRINNYLKGNNSVVSFILKEAFAPFNAYDFLQSVLNTLLFKACHLMDGMLYQTQPSEKVFFDYESLSNVEIKTIRVNCHNYEVDEDDFIRYYNNHDEKSYEKIKEYQKFFSRSFYDSVPKVGNYNKFINDGIYYYLKDRKMHKLLKDNVKPETVINEIKKYINILPTVENAKSISPSLLRKSISWLHKYIDNNNEKESHEVIYLYGKALNYLRYFINVYKNGKDSPLGYRPYFEYSYVKVSEIDNKATKIHFETSKFLNYNSNDFKDCIFFASFQYKPINMEFLNNFYSYHNREHRLFESKAIEKSISRTDGIIDTVKEERGKTLQLVGLLGSFIAFIAASVRFQNNNVTIGEYLTFTCTYVIGVIIFILCVFLISNTTKSSKDNGRLSWCLFFALVVFLAVLVYSTLSWQDSSAVHRLFHLLWH